jgi:hypothetical protein
MAWIITDYDKELFDEAVLKHWNGDMPERPQSLPYKFRMLDDDGNIYFYGESDDSASESAFAPLDDFGLPYAGCTEIQYLENGKWEPL